MLIRLPTLLTQIARRSIVISVLAAGSAVLAGSVAADPLTMSKATSPQQRTAASAYWTRARIAAAPPIALPVDRGRSDVDTAALNQVAVTGPVGSSTPGLAAPGADQIAQAVYSRDWDSSPGVHALHDDIALDLPSDVEAGTASVFTFFDVNKNTRIWKVYPHRWGGKLTFTMPGGQASCSATVISGNNIVTAAHCVYDSTSNVFYNNWVFTPVFRDGAAPFGTFAAQVCTILTAYANLTGDYSINTWARHDVAVCTMGNNSGGQTLNDAVGWAGRMWNGGNTQVVFNSGYPARDYTDTLIFGPAQYHRACMAESFLQTTETLGSGCQWGRGISGGSWLVSYKPLLPSGYVNSVNSGLFLGQANLYGARFNGDNIVLLCNARGC